MKDLLEKLVEVEHSLGFMRNDLLAANKIASEKAPVAHLLIARLLAHHQVLQSELSALIAVIKEE